MSIIKKLCFCDICISYRYMKKIFLESKKRKKNIMSWTNKKPCNLLFHISAWTVKLRFQQNNESCQLLYLSKEQNYKIPRQITREYPKHQLGKISGEGSLSSFSAFATALRIASRVTAVASECDTHVYIHTERWRILPCGEIPMHKVHFLEVLHAGCYLRSHVDQSAEAETVRNQARRVPLKTRPRIYTHIYCMFYVTPTKVQTREDVGGMYLLSLEREKMREGSEDEERSKLTHSCVRGAVTLACRCTTNEKKTYIERRVQRRGIVKVTIKRASASSRVRTSRLMFIPVCGTRRWGRERRDLRGGI